MSFTSTLFLFIVLPLILLCLFLLNHFRVPELVISSFTAILSLVFYAWSGITNLLIMLALSLINYILARCISRCPAGCSARRLLLGLGVVLNIGLLIAYRFFPNVPLGLSFFTFLSVAYLADTFWDKISAERSLIRYMEYIFLFPKVSMGPITRYSQLSDDLQQHQINAENTYLGIRRFCIGFSKKILLANQVGLAADAMFQAGTSIPAGYAWIGLLSYTLQLYLDFSSYSDMAIGLGLILGIHLPENFDYPYIAKTIQEFWRRWHISLSSWFRDYVYIPLGGNRKGKLRTYCNLLIVFFLTGIWHGSSWNFVIWGLFHGLFQLLERGPLGRFLKKSPRWFQHAYTLLIVMLGWVFFRADTFSGALIYLGNLVGIGKDAAVSLEMVKVLTPQYWFFLIISLMTAFPVSHRISDRWKQHWITDYLLILVFILAVCFMAAGNYNPFIYARF